MVDINTDKEDADIVAQVNAAGKDLDGKYMQVKSFKAAGVPVPEGCDDGRLDEYFHETKGAGYRIVWLKEEDGKQHVKVVDKGFMKLSTGWKEDGER